MEIFREQRSEVVAEILKDQWVENYLANRTRMQVLDQLLMYHRGNQEGFALVIGAGPSFEKNYKDITPGLYDIIACDKICPRLAELDIIPNYVVALNAAETEAREWLSTVNYPEVQLVMPAGVHPKTYEGWRGPMHFVNAVTPTNLHHRVQRETGYFPMVIGSNSGTFGYTLAYRLGYNPIAYTALDFSFLTRREVKKYQSKERYNLVEMTDICGDVRYTTLGWFDMADAFQTMAKELHGLGIETINCTEGGINCSKYVENMTLQELNRRISGRR